MTKLTDAEQETWDILSTPPPETVNVYKWQADLMKHLQGFAKGEMVVLCTGRQTGKSMLTQQLVQEWYEYQKTNES